jgi:hypothetical protein
MIAEHEMCPFLSAVPIGGGDTAIYGTTINPSRMPRSLHRRQIGDAIVAADYRIGEVMKVDADARPSR